MAFGSGVWKRNRQGVLEEQPMDTRQGIFVESPPPNWDNNTTPTWPPDVDVQPAPGTMEEADGYVSDAITIRIARWVMDWQFSNG